jgi:hypothetical protein
MATRHDCSALALGTSAPNTCIAAQAVSLIKCPTSSHMILCLHSLRLCWAMRPRRSHPEGLPLEQTVFTNRNPEMLPKDQVNMQANVAP